MLRRTYRQRGESESEREDKAWERLPISLVASKRPRVERSGVGLYGETRECAPYRTGGNRISGLWTRVGQSSTAESILHHWFICVVVHGEVKSVGTSFIRDIFLNIYCNSARVNEDVNYIRPTPFSCSPDSKVRHKIYYITSKMLHVTDDERSFF